MFSKIIQEDPDLLRVANFVRSMFNFDSYKNSYFSVIKEHYNFLKDVDDYESIMILYNGYKFKNGSDITQDFYENKMELLLARRKLDTKLMRHDYEGLAIGDKSIFEKLLDTHTMSEIEELFLVLDKTSEKFYELSIRDFLYESEVPEDIKEIEAYLNSRKLFTLDIAPNATYRHPSNFDSWIVVDNYSFNDTGATHLDAFKDRDCISVKSDTFYMVGLNYIKYCYPFLIEKYHKKDISSLDFENYSYIELLLDNKIIDIGDFSRHIINRLMSPDSSSKDEEIAMKYMQEIDFSLVDRSSLKMINPEFIKRNSLEEMIYKVDPSLFLDELFDCKHSAKLRLLAAEHLPKGDVRLNKLLNEKSYKILSILVDKIPADKLPFLLGSLKGKHKAELEEAIIERMMEEEAIIKYMKRINSENCS